MKQIERNITIDAIKGFNILLVVLGHSIQQNVQDFWSNPWFLLIYAFHMHLFMFTAGFVAFYSLPKLTFNKFVIKRFIGLIIPFLAWAYIFWALLGKVQLQTIVPYTISNIKSLDNTLWFLFVLFVGLVLLALCVKLGQRTNSKVEIISIVALAILLPRINISILNYSQIAFYFAFVGAGYLANKYLWFIKKYYRVFVELFFIALLALVYIRFNPYIPEAGAIINKAVYFAVNTVYSIISERYMVAFGLIFLVFIIFKEIKIKPITNFLAWIGGYTLDIYAIHGHAITAFSIGIFNQNNPIYILINTLFLTVLSILFSELFLRKSFILSFLFLGKSIKFNASISPKSLWQDLLRRFRLAYVTQPKGAK